MENIIKKHLNNYDVCVREVEESVTFSMCPKNDLFLRDQYEEGFDENGAAHLDKCFRRQISLLACVFFKETERHECYYFPIMVGSELEERLFPEKHNAENRRVSYNVEKFLRGYFIITGQIVNIPYLFTNNRERVHIQKKNNNSSYVIFIYNHRERGCVFKKWMQKSNLVFRNENAVEYIGKQIMAGFDPKETLGVDRCHVFVQTQWLEFNLLSADVPSIDEFDNKIILSPYILLKSLINRGKQTIQKLAKLRKVFEDGSFTFFLSQVAQYQAKAPKRSSQMLVAFNGNNLYRRPDYNQIGISIDTFLQIVRPTRKYVKLNKEFPDNAKGFICHYDINCSIDNFAKTVGMVPDVEIMASHPMTLHRAMEFLSTYPDIVRIVLPKSPCAVPGHILLLEIIPTVYKINSFDTFKAFFFALKRHLNSQLEIRQDSKGRIIISSITGTPIKRVGDIMATRWELAHYFPKFYASPALLKTSFLVTRLNKFQAYEEMSKGISAATQLRSAVCSDVNEHLFKYATNCIHGIYVKSDGMLPQYIRGSLSRSPSDIAAKYDPETNEFALKTFICAHPSLNEDAYIINERLNFNILIKKKYDFLIGYDELKDIRVIPFNNTNQPQAFVEYNSNNRPENICLFVATIVTKSPLKLQWSSKIMLNQVEKDVYNLYKRTHDASMLEIDLKDISLELDYYYNKKGLYFLIIISYRVPKYDGMKFTNICGQKGLAVFANLSRFAENGVEPDILVSAFSIISRKPLGQLKERAINMNTPNYIGTTNFILLRNQSSEFKTQCHMKMDRYTLVVMMLNELDMTLYSKAQESEDLPFSSNHKARYVLDKYKSLKLEYRLNDDVQRGIDADEAARSEKAHAFWSKLLLSQQQQHAPDSPLPNV